MCNTCCYEVDWLRNSTHLVESSITCNSIKNNGLDPHRSEELLCLYYWKILRSYELIKINAVKSTLIMANVSRYYHSIITIPSRICILTILMMMPTLLKISVCFTPGIQSSCKDVITWIYRFAIFCNEILHLLIDTWSD